MKQKRVRESFKRKQAHTREEAVKRGVGGGGAETIKMLMTKRPGRNDKGIKTENKNKGGLGNKV